jgi:hypothetical protein
MRTNHDQAVVEAEIKRIVHALSPFGVLHRRALERAASADTWQEADFERALSTAVKKGEIDALPFGFYAIARGERRGAHRTATA